MGLPFSCPFDKHTYMLYPLGTLLAGARNLVTVEIPKLKCPHCKHEWVPRKETRARCPRCQKKLEL